MSAQHFDPRAVLESLGVVGVNGVRCDSRRIRKGDLFAAFPGESADARRFIPQAIERGAAAVLWEADGFCWNSDWSVPNAPVRGLREKLGYIAAQIYGDASRRMWVCGVTGTNGKTSCSHWIAQALTRLGRPTAVIGTLGIGFPGALTPGERTTPDAAAIQEELADLHARGAQGAAMEVSSHGLDQGRVNGVTFAVALFTNLSRDHLDYHGTMEQYGAAKAKLFAFPGLQHAVVNVDDPFGVQLAEGIAASRVSLLRYGLGKGDVAGHRLDLSSRGLKLEITTPWGPAALRSQLLGGFNALNLLGVLAVLLTAGVSLRDAADALAQLDPVAGRLQLLREPNRPLVVIDYAHTPDALQKVLETLRSLLPPAGRLICVFGCGGDRDPGKRPLMGEVATRLADVAVVTSDNPRSEPPLAIIEDIVAGAHSSYHIEPDRALAIRYALTNRGPDDIVLLAGKGHEAYQEIGDQRLPFSDLEVAQAVLKATN
ncbi:MAG TPA: UDP-N-acetylmuramoyl-L-alanyl-D-glutamate--2,6-diaminopimelate ligase [Burkholderiales bacterium]|nr:UDP-N-acetylmuramoyl-L-alanyl-D-glutamate--2,6-diaminopimelate ligase [Burkholderiales bacterium]